MSKSVVAVYCGGRGSGKTLSMSAEGALALIMGKRVWANYPISIGYRDVAGNITSYHSTLIDMPDVIEMQRRDEIRDGLVILDEWNLFCNARRSGAMSNLIFSGIVQLIRKRKLSFYITAQDFMTLDKNIRFQCDITVECFDLSFRYPNLKEGAQISQTLTDWTGVYTGRPIRMDSDRYAMERNRRVRILIKGELFHGCYDTGFEFDVLKTMSARYKLQKEDYTIGKPEDNGGFDTTLMEEYKQGLVSAGVNRVPVNDVQTALADMGISGNLRGDLGKKLKAAGLIWKQGRSGGSNYYELGEKASYKGVDDE